MIFTNLSYLKPFYPTPSMHTRKEIKDSKASGNISSGEFVEMTIGVNIKPQPIDGNIKP